MAHRKLTEKELYRMLDIAASGPLSYIPGIDKALMELGLLQWYDEDPSNVSVEWNTSVLFFAKNGRVLEEWYDFKRPDASVIKS